MLGAGPHLDLGDQESDLSVPLKGGQELVRRRQMIARCGRPEEETHVPGKARRAQDGLLLHFSLFHFSLLFISVSILNNKIS